MFYVYVLKNAKNRDLYIGYTEDLKNRLKLHNSGKVKSTKSCIPWELVYYEAYAVKSDATKREKELKLHAAKELLLKRIKESLTLS